MRWTKLDLTCICYKKIFKVTHRCFKSSSFICTDESTACIFFIFWSSKIRVSPTGVVIFLSSPRCHLSSNRCRHTMSHFLLIESRQARRLRYTFHQRFVQSPPLLSQNQSIESAPLLSATLSGPSDYILHCYKNDISTLTTLPTTQSHLYFASFLARVPRHRSSTHRRHSFSPPSHDHRLSAQRHPLWWTSRSFFASQIAYRRVNSRKNIF
jgi:hypothetical protein